MRVLMSCRPAYGHYAPMVGLARALEDAGHQIRFATADPLLQTIRNDGFDADPAGLSFGRISELRARDRDLADAAKNTQRMALVYFTRSFAGLEVLPRAQDLLGIVRRWRPDLIVYEHSEFAGALVGALQRVPAVNHSFGPLVEENVIAAAGTVAAAHWLASGLPAPNRGGMYDHLYLDIVPPSIQFPHIATIPHVQPLRPVPLTVADDQIPGWLSALGRRPVVTVTFGTVFNTRFDLYQIIIRGLANSGFDVVITTGRSDAAANLGPLPDNVQVHDWVPWGAMVARSSVVLTHGGSGSTLGALARGVPLVMLPLAADHFKNTRAVTEAGVAVGLDVRSLTAPQVLAAVETALEEPLRSAAARVAEEIAAMPAPRDVVPVLAEVAAQR
jgi:UDP:flavonoid glycosyltransferase YjiC (YdhE family)